MMQYRMLATVLRINKFKNNKSQSNKIIWLKIKTYKINFD